MKTTIFLLIFALSTSCFAGRNFNGSSDIDTIPATGNAVDISTGPMTISFWMYPTVVGSSEHEPIAKYDNSSGALQQYVIAIGSLGVGSAGQIGFVVGSFSALLGVYGACGSVTPNHWYNVILAVDTAGVYTGSPAATLSMTGFSSCSTTVAFRERRTAGGPSLTIGGLTGFAPNFAGTMCEIAIWNQILSPNERNALRSGVPPNRVRFPVFYKPYYGVASPEPDLSGNRLNGALTGTTPSNHCPVTPPAGH